MATNVKLNNPSGQPAGQQPATALGAGKSGGKGYTKGQGKGWQPPTLARGFNLEAAKSRAYQSAQGYMNKVLDRDDMHVQLRQAGEELPQATSGTVGEVLESHTGRVVSTYDGLEILRLYARSGRERGIVVDGRV